MHVHSVPTTPPTATAVKSTTTPISVIAASVSATLLIVAVVVIVVLARRNHLFQPRRWLRRRERSYAVVSTVYDGQDAEGHRHAAGDDGNIKANSKTFVMHEADKCEEADDSDDELVDSTQPPFSQLDTRI